MIQAPPVSPPPAGTPPPPAGDPPVQPPAQVINFASQLTAAVGVVQSSITSHETALGSRDPAATRIADAEAALMSARDAADAVDDNVENSLTALRTALNELATLISNYAATL